MWHYFRKPIKTFFGSTVNVQWSISELTYTDLIDSGRKLRRSHKYDWNNLNIARLEDVCHSLTPSVHSYSICWFIIVCFLLWTIRIIVFQVKKQILRMMLLRIHCVFISTIQTNRDVQTSKTALFVAIMQAEKLFLCFADHEATKCIHYW